MIIIKYILIGAGTFCVLGLALFGIILIGPIVLGILMVIGQVIIYTSIVIIPLGIIGWIINYLYKYSTKPKEVS